MNIDALTAFYRGVAAEHDLCFRANHRTWFKLSGHGISVDIRFDEQAHAEVVTVTTDGPEQTAEHLIKSIEAWKKAKGYKG